MQRVDDAKLVVNFMAAFGVCGHRSIEVLETAWSGYESLDPKKRKAANNLEGLSEGKGTLRRQRVLRIYIFF